MWQVIQSIHRAAHLTIAVPPATAADLVGAGACDGQAVKVSAGRAAVALKLEAGHSMLCLFAQGLPHLPTEITHGSTLTPTRRCGPRLSTVPPSAPRTPAPACGRAWQAVHPRPAAAPAAAAVRGASEP